MSDTESSEDENVKKLLLAVDTTFLDSKLYESRTNNVATELPASNKKSSSSDTAEVTVPKSQRYLETEEEIHSSDLTISESMQKFVAKKLSEIIDKTYKFVDVLPVSEQCHNLKKKRAKDRVRLLSDFDVAIKDIDGSLDDRWIKQRRRAEIQKRNPEPDSLSESEKVQSAALNPEFIKSGKDIEAWAKASRPDKVFLYKRGKDGTLYFIEPTNEFTVLRKKNCWSEKRIARDFRDTKKKKVE